MKKNNWLSLEGFPELRVGQYIVPNFVSNSIALHNGQGHWVVVSPGAPMLADWKASLAGSVESLSLVMPNHYHFMGVQDWLEVYPSATLYASQKAISRLHKQGLKNIAALENKSPPLPEGYQFFFPPGHRAGDVWLCRGGTDGVWITCDSFLNYQRLSNQPLARSLQKLLGAAPGLKISQVVKWLILDDRRAFKPWVLKHLEQYPPALLIPGHGEPAQDPNLADSLRELIHSRL